MSTHSVPRPSRAMLVASASLAVALSAAVFALSGPASASGQLTVGPYVSNLSVHDEIGSPMNLSAGQIGHENLFCPANEVLVSGGYHASGSISELSNVVSITGSYPQNSIIYHYSSDGTVTDEFGPKYWQFAAVNPSLAHAVSVTPYVLCLQVQVSVESHA